MNDNFWMLKYEAYQSDIQQYVLYTSSFTTKEKALKHFKEELEEDELVIWVEILEIISSDLLKDSVDHC